MSLIKKYFRNRGTIGGKVDDNLTPVDVVKFTAAFELNFKNKIKKDLTLVIGRDAEFLAQMVNSLVTATFIKV